MASDSSLRGRHNKLMFDYECYASDIPHSTSKLPSKSSRRHRYGLQALVPDMEERLLLLKTHRSTYYSIHMLAHPLRYARLLAFSVDVSCQPSSRRLIMSGEMTTILHDSP